MFKSKSKTVEEKPKERDYLTILSGFTLVVKRDFKIFTNDDLSPTFLDINRGKYDILDLKKAKQNHAAIVSLFKGYDLLDRCNRVIDNAIGTTLADTDELDRLLKGLTNSLTLTEEDRAKIEISFRKFPVLIYARLIELTVVT